jgi:hypothetical protein
MKNVILLWITISMATISAHAVLLNHWIINEGSGFTIADAGTGGNPGTLMEGTAPAASASEGPAWINDPIRGIVLSFDGTSDWILTNSQGVWGATPRTVALWFNLARDNSGANRHTLLEYGNPATAGQYFRLLTENRRLRLEVASGNALALKAGDLSLNRWYHAALVINDFNGDGQTRTTEVRFYLDGQYVPLAQSLNQIVNTTFISDKYVRLGGGAQWEGGSIPREPLAGMMDDVRIYNTALTDREIETLINSKAWNPSPANNSTNQGTLNNGKVDVAFTWNTAVDCDNQSIPNPNIAKHYFYLNTGEPNFLHIAPVEILAGSPPQPTAYLGPISIDLDKTCYWRVDESILKNGIPSGPGDPNTITGMVWKFETQKSSPLITQQPVNILEDAGATVQFTVTAESMSAKNYQWYKSADNANDTPADDILVGTNSSVLTLSDIQLTDEAYYYCVVSNASEVPAVSNPAFLEIKRLTAWYAFEQNLADSAGGNDGIAIKSDPYTPMNYTDGMVGKAIVLNGIDEAVQIPRTIQNSFTIALWVKTADIGGTGQWYVGKGLVDGEISGQMQDFGTSLSGTKFAFGIGNPDITILSTSIINDGQWHYCVATRDQFTGNLNLYVDGLLEAAGTGALTPRNAASTLRIGSTNTGTLYLNGQIDEVKLYNYPLEGMAVAAEYTALSGKSICYARPIYDFDQDCQVTIADFAIFASTWLDCGLVPDCMP